VMTLAVLLSASRSGLVGLMIAFLLSTVLTRRRGTVAVRRWTILQFTLLACVVLWFANYDVLLRRVEESMTRAQQGRGRVAIWRDTIRLAGDFPVTGTGAGTFGKAISVYQTAEPGYAIDQAHNHYLQILAEGGASLLLPGVLAAGLFLLLARRSLEQDLSSNYLIRAGACAGIAGVLVQSIWETGLTMPANALLFAMLAAIATFTEPRAARGTEASQPGGWDEAGDPRA
jgi:O-antigen ligase